MAITATQKVLATLSTIIKPLNGITNEIELLNEIGCGFFIYKLTSIQPALVGLLNVKRCVCIC